jgi:hypothetical protein
MVDGAQREADPQSGRDDERTGHEEDDVDSSEVDSRDPDVEALQ